MTERSVSRAAERLGRTQSAVSHSLSRLRGQLGDPLLIKAGVRMQPTAFALDLIEQTRPMLKGIQRVLSPRYVFEPAHSQRVFRVAAPDFMLTVFAHLLSRLRSEAPGVSAEWTAPREPTLLDVAEGQIDVAIVPAELRLPDGVASEAVGSLGWRCFGRKDHPAFGKWSQRAWTQWPHLVVRVGDSLTSPVNVAASAAGLERTIAGWCRISLLSHPCLRTPTCLRRCRSSRWPRPCTPLTWRAERCRFRLPRCRMPWSGAPPGAGIPR